jgi:predicted amidohydrolase YtcJ
MDHLVGSLEPGKLADFAVLDGDPFSSPPDALRAIGVHMTVQDGETVFQAETAGDLPS